MRLKTTIEKQGLAAKAAKHAKKNKNGNKLSGFSKLIGMKFQLWLGSAGLGYHSALF